MVWKRNNSSKRARAVVIHGADCLNPFIQNNKDWKSLGCPAIPLALTDKEFS
jgi:hypothetical protein